jgi:ubiquinone/menaquinone biosynthesis C-methylase UbiE
MSDQEIKQQVRQFYDQIGWQLVGEDVYQNARYEDLRPVSREYITRCHLRVNRHLKPSGKYLLDAGSGPVQYPAYLTYSEGYQYRVCADISMVALQEARKRLGEKGLFVVSDVANLPFKNDVFEGIVSLHTLHHLPLAEQKKAYDELYRVLAAGSSAVVVNGWTDSKFMNRMNGIVKLMERLGARRTRKRRNEIILESQTHSQPSIQPVKKNPTGTFVEKMDAAWLRRELTGRNLEIRVWRSVSVRFLRAVIHKPLAGKFWLKILFWFEERFPHYYGEQGQYPLIIFSK